METCTSHAKPRQRDRLLALLKSRAPQWVPLTDVLALRISQYGARIYELRRFGHRIESKQEGDRSWFRLVISSAASTTQPPRSPEPTSESAPTSSNQTAAAEPDRLFPDDAHLDLG